MADPQKTEQPTPRRLEKARKEGQYPVSREFVGSLVFVFFVWMIHSNSSSILSATQEFMRLSLESAFQGNVSPTSIIRRVVGWGDSFGLLLAAGIGLSALTLATQLATTGFGVTWGKLRPDLGRLNPLPRLKQLPGQNISSLNQSALLLPVVGWVVYSLISFHWATFMMLPRMALPTALRSVADSVSDLLWKATMVFLGLGVLDLFRQRKRWTTMMRMTKQEVREEYKEVEGNPLIRMRIRRLQREASKRRMMQQVPKATAVVVNPTHYAVAILYQANAMPAPKVVAKGKNWLALRIRQTAIKNQVPVIENQPLAQALYKSADVGQEIPAHLYQAIAEVLAYIYRLMRGQLPGQV